MVKINKIKPEDAHITEWDEMIEGQIAEDAEKHGSMAPEWLRPTHPLFAEPDDYEELDSDCMLDSGNSEYDRIQSDSYSDFDQEWDARMRQQRKEASGGNKGSPVPAS
jgi:hypothetical protein